MTLLPSLEGHNARSLTSVTVEISADQPRKISQAGRRRFESGRPAPLSQMVAASRSNPPDAVSPDTRVRGYVSTFMSGERGSGEAAASA